MWVNGEGSGGGVYWVGGVAMVGLLGSQLVSVLEPV